MKARVEIRNPSGRVLRTYEGKLFRGCIPLYGELVGVLDDNGVKYAIDDLPEPGDPIVPLDEELSAKIAWFVQNRVDIRALTGVRYVDFI